jgi:hypothetical protein
MKKVLFLQKNFLDMEKSYKSLSLFDFQQRFATDNQCLAYLAAEKWKDGYICSRCEHTSYCQGNTLYSRQCTRCKYTESPTSGTLFHKVKFPLLTLYILFRQAKKVYLQLN